MRRYSSKVPLLKPGTSTTTPRPTENINESQGAMYRRLEEATEDALLNGGRAGRRAFEEAGFDEELKSRLLNKIADAKFLSEHGNAIVSAGLNPVSMKPRPSSAEAPDITPWTGEEAMADTVFRMLDDARKPLVSRLRGKPNIPAPIVMDPRPRQKPPQNPGQRVVAAQDKAAAYAESRKGIHEGPSESEREAFHREFRERFTPGARIMPNSISGLAALANERIEDAIARGQFRNIPRGPGVERDSRADNPFIDTTEYIMNKMIQRQDMVPPWIEKQQEVVRETRAFRTRLRNNWRRHAARSIASRGGSLQAQMAQARAYAQAEQGHKPRCCDVEHIAVPTNTISDPIMARVREVPMNSDAIVSQESGKADTMADAEALPSPFRDPQWEVAERSYMELTVHKLNALIRSYNLMAPELAKKPYLSLERELQACFADVAPT